MFTKVTKQPVQAGVERFYLIVLPGEYSAQRDVQL